jgi:predicted PurR-regulated permease PerM
MTKGLAVLCFCCLTLFLFWLFINSLHQAVGVLPLTAQKAIPMLVELANKNGFDLPFSDSGTLRSFVVEELRDRLTHLVKFAQLSTKEFLYVIIGLVVTCGIFVQRTIDLGAGNYKIRHNIYSAFTDAISKRFTNFFTSFHTVMGAQVIISTVNTFFTGLFLVILYLCDYPLPYSVVIVVVTFLCGLLPIVGNLISNTVIFFIGLSQSMNLGLLALTYLIVLHKFEYFLNSKIIGGKIENPMWLTLLGLLAGERLGGVPGMILAPVVLHYCKFEASALPYTPSKDKP